MENQTVKEGKTTAIISYITWIGTLIAFIMNNSKRNSFASFHIRQMLGILVLSIVASLIGRYINGFLGWLTGVLTFVLWIVGFIGALQGEEKRVPFLGDQFQDWFKGIS
ncbi:DUF4870 domain-containing protein [Lutibacter sp. B1]|uniref:DUF4870 domain-containing protein n=1 Tax=Lutibacter sp. B1 TaxID=2725996 RepID=UPI00145716A6|nr:hypothetical protein [Lutibacter sp. B1]NLP57001.1 hypothetical protein [Lutibacter sp. B1]